MNLPPTFTLVVGGGTMKTRVPWRYVYGTVFVFLLIAAAAVRDDENILMTMMMIVIVFVFVGDGDCCDWCYCCS